MCGRYGLDMSKSSTNIYYSNSCSLENRAQSEDRILHPQKSEPLLTIDLAAKGTVDEKIVYLLQRKDINAEFFMQDLRKYIEDMKASIR
jgi:hypothetical protein